MNKRKIIAGWILVGIGVVCWAGAEQSLLYGAGGAVFMALGISIWLKADE